MKVALMLHGQARNLEHGYESQKRLILDKYDVDVFCQLVWDDTIKKNGYYVGRTKKYVVSPNTPKIIKELYKPKKIRLSRDYPLNGTLADEFFSKNPKFKKYRNIGGETDIFTNLMQFKGIMEASNLFDWSQYDFIIKSRYDIGFTNFPNLNQLDNNKFYSGQDYNGTFLNKQDWFIDLSYILGKNFKNYTLIYNHLKNDNFPFLPFPGESVYNYYLHKLEMFQFLEKLPYNEFAINYYG